MANTYIGEAFACFTISMFIFMLVHKIEAETSEIAAAIKETHIFCIIKLSGVVFLLLTLFHAISAFNYNSQQYQQKIHEECLVEWNEGIHKECGGKWKIQSDMGYDGYCYECRKCGEQIILKEYFEPLSVKQVETNVK